MDEGLYESLLTERLHTALGQRSDLHADTGSVDDGEQPQAITRHLSPLIERSLRAAGTAQDRAELVRAILAVLPDDHALAEVLHQREPGRIDRLEALTPAHTLGVTALPRPATPLSDAALMTNAHHEPTLAAELRAELASADQVDLLCAFVKWHGLRLLDGPLAALRERGVPLRVITTTYLGATDARALDALVDEFGAQVRVNYETDRTRLHAKAWLLRRNTEFHTAYVGSSNLSHAALVDGLEWNVRLSAVSTPHLLEKFRVTSTPTGKTGNSRNTAQPRTGIGCGRHSRSRAVDANARLSSPCRVWRCGPTRFKPRCSKSSTPNAACMTGTAT